MFHNFIKTQICAHILYVSQESVGQFMVLVKKFNVRI